MKVLIVSDAWHPQVNGVVRTYEHLGEELEKRGHAVKVIGPADFPLRLPLPGYAEIKLALAPYRRLESMIADYAPDAIHIATEGPLGWAARKYCRKNNLPFTTTYHTHFPDYVAKRVAKFLPFLYGSVHEGGRRFVRKFHEPARAVMVATQSLADELKDWGFAMPLRPLTRGAKLEQFYPGPKTLFSDMPQPVALYVGRVAIEKSIEDFLTMDWPGSKVIVGDGPSLPELKNRYPTAHFAGIKTGVELADHYRSADVFVFPSRTDTFGMVIVEALACGIPVAGYDATGPRDIITRDFLGAIDDYDLAVAARRALDTGTSEQRTAHVKENFTWEKAGAQFEETLKLYRI